MEKRCFEYHSRKKKQVIGYLLLGIMGIHVSIANGAKIIIKLIPNLNSLLLESFKNEMKGQLIINKMNLMVYKETMSKDVVLAHSNVMEKTPVLYPFEHVEIMVNNLCGWKMHIN